MPHYIAVIHKEPGSLYGVSFPDVPGIVAAGETLDDALLQAAEVLAFAAEDWQDLTGHAFPQPSTLDALRRHSDLDRSFAEGVVAAVPFDIGHKRAA